MRIAALRRPLRRPRRILCRRFASALPREERSYDGLWANTTFEALGVHPDLVQSLAAQDILRPTVVQAEAFAPLVKGRDVILRAETGSGKTLAYLLPLVNRIYHLHDRAREAARLDPDAPNPLASSRPWVVLTPTSDLSAQVLSMLESIDSDRLVACQSLQRLFKWEAQVIGGRGSLASGALLGGGLGADGSPSSFREPRAKERTTLDGSLGLQGNVSSRGSGAAAPYAVASPRIRWGSTDLVVSTPMKFCEDLEQFKEDGIFPACIVMDEADALFQGTSRLYLFEIFQALRPRLKIRQMDEQRKPLPDMIPTQFVFSAATMVHIGPFSEGNMLIERFCTAHTVETKHFHRLPAGIGIDNVRWVPASDDWDRRVDQLLELLRTVPCERTLVFVNSVHNCHVLLKFLRDKGWPVVSFMKGPQGRMGPRFRDAQKFAEGQANIMIATDHGGRGIDWHQVDHVVNFQLPSSAVNWIHRVGRTGRMGKRGLVTNFVAGKDQTLSELIQMQLQAGKDLHGAFSRKRSLRRRAQRGLEEIGDSEDTPGEDGSYRLDGGLELLNVGGASASSSGGQQGRKPERSSAPSAEEGTLIGYLSAAALDDSISSSRRAGSRRAAADLPSGDQASEMQRSSRAGQVQGGVGDDESLMELRQRLLASDSESDAEDALSGGESEDEDVATKATARGRAHSPSDAPFSWSQLADSSAGSSLGPAPVRALDRGSDRRKEEEPRRARRYLDQDGLPGGSQSGGRKKLGVRSRNKLDASRNYASPDDDLLL